jgi:hypothetical protein
LNEAHLGEFLAEHLINTIIGAIIYDNYLDLFEMSILIERA